MGSLTDQQPVAHHGWEIKYKPSWFNHVIRDQERDAGVLAVQWLLAAFMH